MFNLNNLKYIFSVTFVFFGFMYVLSFYSVHAAGGCAIGAFNYDDPNDLGLSNRDDCPTLGIGFPDSDVVRVDVSDEYEIVNNMIPKLEGNSGSTKYLMPQNEPNLESKQTPKEVADNIKLWVDAALADGSTNISIVIPPYAHNQGSINGGILSQQEAVLAELQRSGYLNKGVNFVLGINAYGNEAEVLSMVAQQSQSAAKYGVNNIMLTEVAIATHQDVLDGKISVADWMHQTAQLVYNLQNGSLSGTWMFTSLLIGAQVPLFIDPVTGDYVFGCGDNLIRGNVKSGATSYSGNITDLGCGAPSGPLWNGKELIDGGDFCTPPETYSGALNCIECAVREDIAPKDLSFFAKLRRVFTSPFVKGFAFEMTLDSFENPITKLNDENQKLFASDESDLAYWWGKTYNYKNSSNVWGDNLPGLVPPTRPNLPGFIDPELAQKYNSNIENAESQEKRTSPVTATPDYAVATESTDYINALGGLAGDLNLSLEYPTADCDLGGCYKLGSVEVDLTGGNTNITVPGGTVIWPTGSNPEYTIMGRSGGYDPRKGEQGSYMVIGGRDISKSQRLKGLGLSYYNPDPTTDSNHISYTANFVPCESNADCKSNDLVSAVKPVNRRKSAEIVAQVENVPAAAEAVNAVGGYLMNTPENYISSGTYLGISQSDLYSQLYIDQKNKAVAQANQEFLAKNYSYEDIISLRKAQRGVVSAASNSKDSKVETLEAKDTQQNTKAEQIALFSSSLCSGAKDGSKEPACSKDSFIKPSVIVEDLDGANCSLDENGNTVCESADDIRSIDVDVTIGCYNGVSCGDPTGVTPFSDDLSGIYKSPPVSENGLVPITTMTMMLSSYIFKPGQDLNDTNLYVKHSPEKVDFNPVAEDIEKQVGKTVYPNELLTAQELALPGGSYGECGGKMLYSIHTNPDAEYVDNPNSVPLGDFTIKTKQFIKSYDCFPSSVDDYYNL